MKTRSILSALSLLLLTTAASAQSTIYGRDSRNGGRIFTSDTANFVANLTTVGPSLESIFALDFDQTATTLWGVNNTTLEYGTIDITTGVFTVVGVITGPAAGASGLTCDVNGVWYLSSVVTGGTDLYVGDVTTGTFTLVGLMGAGTMIDISIDSQGNLYGNNITDDNLYSIDTTTGAATLIGPSGQATNFAQGMDFDWSTDTLYATLYTGGGTGVFAAFDLTTGLAVVLESTTSTNAEMEMAVQVAAPTGGGSITPFCFGDGSGSACPCSNTGAAGRGCENSAANGGALLSTSGSASIAAGDLVLDGSGARPNQPGLFFQGTNAIGGGTGIIAGDGLRCVNGSVVRLQITTTGVLGDTATSVNIGAAGSVSAGDTRYYQWWYRDPLPGACGSSFNYSNGIEVVWAP